MRDIVYRIFGEKSKKQLVGCQITLASNQACLKFFATITLSIFLLGCNGDNKVPNGLLNKEEMAEILTDFYLKETRLNALRVPPDSTQKLMLYYRLQHANQSGIADSVVELSYQYYVEHPKELSEIYDRIIDSLALREQRIRVDGPRKLE